MNSLIALKAHDMELTIQETYRCWCEPVNALHIERAELTGTDPDRWRRLGTAWITVRVEVMNINDSPTGELRQFTVRFAAHDRNDRKQAFMEIMEMLDLGLPTGAKVNHYEFKFVLHGIELDAGETVRLTVRPMR